MTRARFARAVSAIAAAMLGAVIILMPSAASAGVVTTVKFETESPVTVGFGEGWFLRLSVTSSYDEGPTLRLTPADGTVDVYFSGIGGAFASGLAIQPDGLVYVSQPTNQPLLPAGDYQVSAIFNPTAGGYYDTSQTATPLQFTVTALEVVPKVEVINDAAVSAQPIITASVSGSYVDSVGGAPAGTWHFLVTDADDQPVFESDVAQAQGSSEPLRVEVAAKLDKGMQYAVVSTFTPVEELAGGLTVGTVADATFQTPSGTFGEAITGAVPMPLWLAIALLAIFIGLVVTAIIIGVKLAGTAASVAPAASAASPQRMPGDPLNVEVVSLYDLGLPDPETIPELLPEGHTKKLPTSTTWLLSDVEPATGLPDASEAPTERLDAITAAELPTELIDSTEVPTQAEKPKDS